MKIWFPKKHDPLTHLPGDLDTYKKKNQVFRQVQTKQYEKSPSGSSAAIGGSVAAVVAVVIVILVAYIVVRKRRNASKEGRESNNYIPPNRRSSRRDEHVYVNVVTSDCKNRTSLAVESANVNETDIDEDEVIYVNGPNDIKLRGETKILVSKLKEVVTTKHENEMYEVEFKSLPHGLKHPHETSKLTQNLQLNRFKTTFPYDHSRVILKKEKKNSTDYINANFIDGVRKQKAYIATQGPKAVTMEDFWRMTWQNNCGKIVMLANLVELGKVKCTTYWTGDDGHPLELGLFQVTMQEEMTYAFYTIRKLSVKNKETNSTRQITQYHFTRWPDHGVPEPFELLQFQKRVSSGHTKHKGPLIVHCSAGIGRTGTYIALDALLLDGKNNGDIDVFAYTETMRKDRMNMIQTAKQYEMLHYVLLEALKVETESMSKTDFCKAIADMFEDNIPTQQYAMVNLERPEYNTSDYKTALTNKKKNRDPSILAVEKYRTRLMSTPSGYINAVNIPGYRTPYGYILTQHPLDYTVTDFLSLVAEERSGIVVSIGSLESNPSWPTTAGSQAKFGNFLITNIQSNHHSLGSERVEERQLAIENKETGADTKITLFETPSWGRTLPKSSFMMELIQTIQCKRGLDAPAVIITCRDGATESGLLCVLCNVMERLEVHGDVDIMAAVRQIQIRRPQCISSKEQYIFCYRLIQDYLEASTVYANV
ncbi:receptor-type tyrosine-protein phosphatase delta-like [Ylistrum balloti]|uniref:receptor-type tyrosine-protein phosphatase delta-like n=1 Tax=Ylistrum balloti TaxID=509963 RepID=UPI002905CD1F|nr:receptor-type tyrosine-protein phosphatase delta-like [Ylistrum balloti]